MGSHPNELTSLAVKDVPGEKYHSVPVEVTSRSRGSDGLVIVSRCDYYEYLKCYCLAFPHSDYPHGIQAVTLSPRNNTDIISFLVAPANFYDFSRKLNKFELQSGFGYEYIVNYEIYQQYLGSEENPCKQNLSWQVDNCKMEKESCKE